MVKKLFLLVSVLAVLFTFSGCNENIKSYTFQGNREMISCISIVYVSDQNKDEITDYSVECTVTDVQSFLNDFTQIPFHKYILGDPTYLSDEYAILIEYENGDREFISYDAQQFVQNSMTYFGKSHCEKNEFMGFINQYLGNTEESSAS